VGGGTQVHSYLKLREKVKFGPKQGRATSKVVDDQEIDKGTSLEEQQQKAKEVRSVTCPGWMLEVEGKGTKEARNLRRTKKR